MADLHTFDDQHNHNTIEKEKLVYTTMILANLFFVFQAYVHLFILYQVYSFARSTRKYKNHDVYCMILSKDVPAIPAFLNFDLLRKFFERRLQNNSLVSQQAFVQATINDYVQHQLHAKGVA